METNAHEDEQFIKWILNKTAAVYWEFDEHGKRSKLKPGWEKAKVEQDRILALKGKSEKGLKVCQPKYRIAKKVVPNV
jgi:hypothetical protein